MIQILTVRIQPGPRREAERRAALEGVRGLFGSTAWIDHTPQGAPVVKGTNFPGRISVTHSGEWLMLAVGATDAPGFGIDLERRSERVSRVMPRVMTPEENGLDPLLCWTAKEAVFKAFGDSGLVVSEVVVSRDGLTATARGRKFRLSHPAVPEGFMATLAVEIV